MILCSMIYYTIPKVLGHTYDRHGGDLKALKTKVDSVEATLGDNARKSDNEMRRLWEALGVSPPTAAMGLDSGEVYRSPARCLWYQRISTLRSP